MTFSLVFMSISIKISQMVEKDLTDDGRYNLEPDSELLRRLDSNPVFQRAPQLFLKVVDDMGSYDGTSLLKEIKQAGLGIINLKCFDAMKRTPHGAASPVRVVTFTIDAELNQINIITGDGRTLVLRPYSYEIDDARVISSGGKLKTLPLIVNTSDNSISTVEFDLSIPEETPEEPQ